MVLHILFKNISGMGLCFGGGVERICGPYRRTIGSTLQARILKATHLGVSKESEALIKTPNGGNSQKEAPYRNNHLALPAVFQHCLSKRPKQCHDATLLTAKDELATGWTKRLGCCYLPVCAWLQRPVLMTSGFLVNPTGREQLM